MLNKNGSEYNKFYLLSFLSELMLAITMDFINLFMAGSVRAPLFAFWGGCL